MNEIRAFTLHNDRGLSVADAELPNWRKYYPSDKSPVFGPIARYSWLVSGKLYEIQRPSGQSWEILPDSTGFICFEDRFAEDNCLLLDAYGKERMRLTVPWMLTGNEGIPPEMRTHGKPRPKRMWFIGLATAWNHPKTGEPGKLGVTAHLEYGEGPYDYHDYYFELDWQTGEFLWGRPIRI
jgi:hypothetical protein